jgi:hypothetical protein
MGKWGTPMMSDDRSASDASGGRKLRMAVEA